MTRHFSLRARVLLVGLLAIGVSLVLSTYQYRAEKSRRLAVAGRNAMATAASASAAVGFVLQDLYGFAHGTERAEPVRDAAKAPEACNTFLSTTLELGSARSMVTNIFAFDAQGRLLCQARPGELTTRTVDGGHYPWARIGASRDYLMTSSTPFFGGISQRWIEIVSVERESDGGGVLAVAVDLARLNEVIKPVNDVTSLITVADAEGNTLLRSSEFEQRVAKKVPFQPNVPGISDRKWGDPVARDTAGGIMATQLEPVISVDSYGAERVWATHVISGIPWVVYAGVSSDAAYVPILLDTAPLVAVGLVLMVVALLASVSRELTGLMNGVEAAASRGPTAIPVDGSKEIRELGQTLRDAFEQRQDAEARLEAANRDLEQRVGERSEELQAKAADLGATNAKLVAAARIKDDFLAVMSHELRTPLSAVLGLTDALREGVYGDVSARQLEVLGLTNDAGRHLLGLVNDVLDFSKVQAGGFSLEWEPVVLGDVIRAAVAMIRPLADSRRLALVLPSPSGGLAVRGDSRRLRQVLVNLLGNAVKFTPEGGTIRIGWAVDDEARWLTLEVADTGIGIAADYLDKIFDPFTQGHRGLDRRFNGTGLGLALSRGIVEAHGGTLTVTSTLSVGSTFTVRLPGPAAQAAPADAAYVA